MRTPDASCFFEDIVLGMSCRAHQVPGKRVYGYARRGRNAGPDPASRLWRSSGTLVSLRPTANQAGKVYEFVRKLKTSLRSSGRIGGGRALMSGAPPIEAARQRERAEALREILAERVLVLDGATGTWLQG